MLARHGSRLAALRPRLRPRVLAAARPLCAAAPPPPAAAETVRITFVEDGEDIDVDVPVGKTLLEAAHDNDIDLEGACDGSLACSTCHLVLEESVFDALPEPEEEELDMLDLAFGLTDTSRLGCQVCVERAHAGMRAIIPGGSHDMSQHS